VDGNGEVLNNSAYVFTPDGLIGNEKSYNEASPKKVLYILQESHTPVDDEEYLSCYFWIRNRIHMGKRDRPVIARIQKMHNIIMGKDDADLKAAAYMNVNKNGSKKELDGRLNESQFVKYAMHFSQFIKREIEILNPDYIVCCGNETYDAIKSMVGDNKILLNMIHPSAPFKYRSNDAYFSKFEEELKKAEHNAKTGND